MLIGVPPSRRFFLAAAAHLIAATTGGIDRFCFLLPPTHTHVHTNKSPSLSLSSSSFFFFFFLYCSWPTKKPSGRVLFFDPRQQKPLRYFSLIIAAAATVMADSQLFNIHSNKLVVPSRSSAAAAAAHQLISDFSISIEYYL